MALSPDRKQVKGAKSSNALFAPFTSKLHPLPRLFLWIAPILFLGVFFFYPLVRILIATADFHIFSQETLQITFKVASFTSFQATLSTLLTLALGLPAAFLFAHYDFPGKSWLRAITAIPFMLPTVVVAAGFSALLGPRGWINLLFMGWFNLDHPPIRLLGTLSAILIAHVFYNTTIVIRIMSSAMARLDPKLEQAARSLGADSLRVWLRITLPLLVPHLLAALLLVYLFDFTSFGVILLLGGPSFITLEVEIFRQAVHLLNLPLAAWLSIIQLIFTLVISIFYSRVTTRNARQTNPHPAAQNIRRARTFGEAFFVFCMTSIIIILYCLPLAALPIRSFSRLEAERGQRGAVQYGLTLDYYKELFINRRNSLFYVPPILAARTSLAYAGATILLSLAMGIPAAIALSKPARLERILDPVLVLPLGASAVTLGLGFIITFGKWLASPLLVPVAHTLIALPFVIRTLQPAILTIPDRLRQAAATLGASPFQVRKNIDWPILSRATLAAGTFAFTISLGEFGTALLITRPEYPTIPVAIYRFLSQPGGLNYGQAMAAATLLMVITMCGILLIEKIRLPGTEEF